MSSNLTANMVVDLWESVREQVPEKKREDIAAAMLEVLLDHHIIEDIKDLEEARGSDTYLDGAIDLLLEEHEDGTDESTEEEYEE
jgi:hypothetical protein